MDVVGLPERDAPAVEVTQVQTVWKKSQKLSVWVQSQSHRIVQARRDFKSDLVPLPAQVCVSLCTVNKEGTLLPSAALPLPL